jgi:hypothetical protein
MLTSSYRMLAHNRMLGALGRFNVREAAGARCSAVELTDVANGRERGSSPIPCGAAGLGVPRAKVEQQHSPFAASLP